MESPLDKYLREHTSAPGEALEWLEARTNVRTNYPQMLSGPVQGRLLRMLVELTGAERVLEIGTFTGYSAACMALGLPEGGHVDTVEINDELEDLVREGWERAGVAGRITLHIADAREWLKTAGAGYDMVYIDANKREYPDFLSLVLPLVKPGGLIVADDVLQGGKVYADPMPGDAQTKGLAAFNDMAASNPEMETVMLPLFDGLTLIRKIPPRPQR